MHLHLALCLQRPPAPNAGEAAGTHIRFDQLICGSLELLTIQQGQARRSRYAAKGDDAEGEERGVIEEVLGRKLAQEWGRQCKETYDLHKLALTLPIRDNLLRPDGPGGEPAHVVLVISGERRPRAALPGARF